jgi:hypothetical protein
MKICDFTIYYNTTVGNCPMVKIQIKYTPLPRDTAISNLEECRYCNYMYINPASSITFSGS